MSDPEKFTERQLKETDEVLTARQLRIYQLLHAKHTQLDIAVMLKISPRTVGRCVANIKYVLAQLPNLDVARDATLALVPDAIAAMADSIQPQLARDKDGQPIPDPTHQTGFKHVYDHRFTHGPAKDILMTATVLRDRKEIDLSVTGLTQADLDREIDAADRAPDPALPPVEGEQPPEA